MVFHPLPNTRKHQIQGFWLPRIRVRRHFTELSTVFTHSIILTVLFLLQVFITLNPNMYHGWDTCFEHTTLRICIKHITIFPNTTSIWYSPESSIKNAFGSVFRVFKLTKRSEGWAFFSYPPESYSGIEMVFAPSFERDHYYHIPKSSGTFSCFQYYFCNP